jgi:hypothetical protein
MLTCPKCGKEMHPICGNPNCICIKNIPLGELPMKNVDLLFGKWKVSAKLGNFLWHMTWNINIGRWVEKLIFKLNGKLTSFSNFGIQPASYIYELEECPYCGYDNSYDYWEDRCMRQAFYIEENWEII